MRRSWRTHDAVAAVLALVVAWTSAAGANPPIVEGTAPLPLLAGGRSLADLADVSVDEIGRGDVGFGVTEGSGGPFRFDVEVVDLLRSGRSTPLILVRTRPSGDDTRFLVAAGMSGSPVYLGAPGEERLAGALGYALAGGEHDLALVVPIAEMRALGQPSAERGPEGRNGPVVVWNGLEAVPIATPVVVGGLTPRAMHHLLEVQERSGISFVPVASSVVATPPDTTRDGRSADTTTIPTPGDAVGFSLVRGDVQIAAIGTVTAVDGRDVWALGHPLTHSGALPYAWVDAHVSAIVANGDLPYKLAGTDDVPMGSTFWDGRAGVYGRLGSAPVDVPLRVVVDGPDRRGETASRIVVDAVWTPGLASAVVQRTVDDVVDERTGGTATIQWTLRLVGRDPVVVVDHLYDADDVATRIAASLGAPLHALLRNPFTEPGLASIDVAITVDRSPDTAYLLEVALEAPTARPGDEVVMFVRTQPYRSLAVTDHVRVTLPDDTPDGPLRLYVRGGSMASEIDEDAAPEWTFDPDRQATSGRPPILSFEEWLSALSAKDTGRDLIVEVVAANGGRRRLATVPGGDVLVGRATVTVMVVDATSDVGTGTMPSDTTMGER